MEMESASPARDIDTVTYDNRYTLMQRWLREPLLHFLVAGGLMFGAYAWLNAGGEENGPGAVRITPAEVNWLKENWTRQWMRPPSDDELRGLLTGYLKEVLLAREAMEIGLDEDDTIIRRRLAQKMEFLVQDTLHKAEPSEEELRVFYHEERERFQTPVRVSFSHIYFNRERRGEETTTDARAALLRLSDLVLEQDPAELGDRFLGQYEFVAADEQTVASTLGPAFAAQVFAATPGTWTGPLDSGFGVHLIRVTDRQASQQREFADVRETVLTQWRQQRAQQGIEAYFASLYQKYDVKLDELIASQVGPLAASMEPTQ